MLGQVIGKSLARIQTGQNTDKRNPDLDGREKPVRSFASFKAVLADLFPRFASSQDEPYELTPKQFPT